MNLVCVFSKTIFGGYIDNFLVLFAFGFHVGPIKMTWPGIVFRYKLASILLDEQKYHHCSNISGVPQDYGEWEQTD